MLFGHDQIGSVRVITDNAGAKAGTVSYSSFGGVLAQAGTASVFGYAGEYTDTETGFVYLRARYYDPSTGQFINRDPAFGSTLSAYGYGNNSPTNMTDPSGLCGLWDPGDCWKKVGQAIIDVKDNVVNGAKAVGKFVVDHRGAIATGLAIAGCIAPGLDAGCAAYQTAAFAIRAQQRGLNSKGNIVDGVLTWTTMGLVGAPGEVGSEGLTAGQGLFSRFSFALPDIGAWIGDLVKEDEDNKRESCPSA